MSNKKQSPSLCKLFSFYEELPEVFLDETDVDSQKVTFLPQQF